MPKEKKIESRVNGKHRDLAFVTAGIQVIFINFIGTTYIFFVNLHLNNVWEVMDKTANSKDKNHPVTIQWVALSDPPKSNFYQ